MDEFYDRLTVLAPEDLERCQWLMERYGTEVWSQYRVNRILERLHYAATGELRDYKEEE